MVSALLNEILQALGKRKRRLLEGMELHVPPPLFLPVRKRVLRELGKDEFEKELAEIVRRYVERHGKGK
jgi:hypothetical protein